MTATSVMAQEVISLRAGLHDEYVRLVFDFDAPPQYDVSKTDPNAIRLVFNTQANLGEFDDQYKAGNIIKGIQAQNNEQSQLVIDVSLNNDSRHRAFQIGSRVILDVYQAEGQDAPAQQTSQTQTQTSQVNSEQSAGQTSETVSPENNEVLGNQGDLILDASDANALEKLKAALAPSKEDTDEQQAEAPQAAQLPNVSEQPGNEQEFDPLESKTAGLEDESDKDDQAQGTESSAQEETILEKAAPDVRDHIITITLTQTVGIAGFQRAGWLWLVLDRSNVDVPPKIAGPQPDLFGSFIRQDLEGGIAYRMKLPDDMPLNFYAEGGGLLWRVIISEADKGPDPLNANRSFEAGENVRGGEIVWPFNGATKVLNVPDPSVGDILQVVTVAEANEFSGPPHEFVDFNVLSSFAGLAIQPSVDELRVERTTAGVSIDIDGGLAISRRKDVNRRIIREEVQGQSSLELAAESSRKNQDVIKIFDFDRWQLGGLQALEENQRLLMATINNKDRTGQVQDLLTLAKINISNDRGQEAIGFLRLAAQIFPEIQESVQFRALLGASFALSGKHRSAFRVLFDETLDPYTEIDYWRAYTLAWLEDWDQAGERLPYNFTLMLTYPQALLEKIGIKTAEIALRNGYIDDAERILSSLGRDQESLAPSTQAALTYLKGVAHNISGEYDRAAELWTPLLTGKDDFFRARAGLALTLQDIQLNNIKTAQAIDRLEGLRYAWRGDELEASISFLLGRQYIEQDLYIRGFTLLRDAASLRPDTDVSQDITEFMLEKFSDIILNEENLTPIDAAALYEEFRELVPVDQSGHKVIAKLAERMVEADLLDRAESLLENQVNFRLQGMEKARTQERLATIYLLDDEPQKALSALNEVKRDYARFIVDTEERDNKLLAVDLLRARAMSQQDQPEEALDLLDSLGTQTIVSRLRADIAWQAGLWDEAADAIQNLILDADIDSSIPLTESQAELVLNRAVSLNLAGDRVEVAAMRSEYSEAISGTEKARLFEVVTRPRQTSIIADQQTILSLVNEVDLFKEFLDSYQNILVDE